MALILYSDYVEKSVSFNLKCISGYCPSSILKKAKNQRDVKKFFCSDQVANDFILLDNEIKIDKDDEGVSQFSHTIFNFVDSLANLVVSCHRYLQRPNDIKCTVFPAGSFPQNVKIETLDEFDFVLVLESESKSPNIFEGLELIHLEKTYSTMTYDIERLLRKCANKYLIVETNLLQKDHCVNLIISWMCPIKHKHSLSLDIAISLKTTTKVRDFFRKFDFPLKGTPFEKSIDRNDNMYWNCHLSEGAGHGRIDTNIFDKQLFDKCDDISPNIKRCFRLIKFISAHTFPFNYKETKCQIKKEEVNCHKPVYSSFTQKQLLYKEVNKYPSSEHWKNIDICARLASILENFASGHSSEEVMAGGFLLGEKTLIGSSGGLFRKVLTGLIEYLHKSEVKIFSEPKMLSSSKEIVFEASEVIMNANESALKALYDAWRDLDYWLYKFGLFEPTLIENNIFCGIYQTFHRVIDDVKKVDLVGFSEYDLQNFLLLLNTRIITKEDTESASYARKLNSFNQMLEFYGVLPDEVFDPYLELTYEEPPKAEILKQISWEKAGAIYKNQQELSTLQLTKNESMVQSMLESAEYWSKSIKYRALPVKFSFQEFWLLASRNYIENMK